MSEHAQAAPDEQGKSNEHSYIHVSPWQTLVAVWVALVVLTGLTVWVATYDVGRLDLAVAMAIATVKCFLVMGFFMHLKYDRAMNRLLLAGSVLFVALFLGITVLDMDASRTEISSYRSENPLIQAPEETPPSKAVEKK